MEEHVDILDDSGQPTGRIAAKSEAHQKGWFHPTVHIWFYSSRGQVLLQQRAPSKDTFPNLWDVSVAGHMHTGETPEEAALREVREEIGLEMQADALEFIGRYKSEHAHDGGVMDREFHHCFVARLNIPFDTLKAETSEVARLQLVSLLRFAEEVWGLANTAKYVPHGAEYYGTVIREIQSRL
jgi:isopentenyldiphosphate isomerase